MHNDAKAYGILLVFVIIGSFSSGFLFYHYVIPYLSTEEEQTPEIHNHYYLNETNVYLNESVIQNQNITQFFTLEFNITLGFSILANGTNVFYFSCQLGDSFIIMKYNVQRAFSLYAPKNASLVIYDYSLTNPLNYTRFEYNVSDFMMEEFLFVPNHAIMVIFTFYDIIFYQGEPPIACYVTLRVI